MRSRLLSVISLCVFFHAASCISAHAESSPGDYSAEKIAAFTRFLISKKEYYRASVELRRLNSYYPGFVTASEYAVTDSYLMYHGGQYDDLASRDCSAADSLKSRVCTIFAFDAYLAMGAISSLAPITSAWAPGIDPDFDACFIKRKMVVSLLEGKFSEAEDLIRKFPVQSITPSMCASYREKYERLKNPYLAAALGIIPGMGYVYAGNSQTGITALAVIMFDAALAFFSFYTGNQPLGIFLGAAGTFFYGGSILGGYLAAGRYNEALMKNARDRLTEDMGLEKDLENVYLKYGLRNAR